ncbi:MAG: hypothetical protein H0X45_15415 [Planctomycetes bacterium]|nr:hypothetical protein [Planctomycetota bacterium]
MLAGRYAEVTHPPFMIQAALMQGRLEPAFANDGLRGLAETIRLIDRLAAGALSDEAALAALAALGEDDAGQLDTVMHAEWRLRGIVRPAMRALLSGDWTRLDRSLDAIEQSRHRYADAQRAWHWARRLRGRCTDEQFQAQPCCAFVEAELMLIHALIAERDGRADAARSAWRAWLDLPWYRRAEQPDPLWQAFARWRGAFAASP